MILKRILVGLVLALISGPVFSQSLMSQPAPTASSDAASTPTPTFDLADVHVSAKTTTPFFTGGSLRGDRYILHNATMVDMVSLAYGMDRDNVLSGPAWLDTDRFDVAAHAPRTTSPDDIKLMLQALLADRFHLVLHPANHPLPSYVLRVDKAGLKMKQADEGEAPAWRSTTLQPTSRPASRPTTRSPAITEPWSKPARCSRTSPANTSLSQSSTQPA